MRYYSKNINIEIPSPVSEILDTLNRAGFEAYIVGGCVRDSILGRTPKDWDITTQALPYQVKSLFRSTADTGLEHGTVMVIKRGTGYEVTTFRIDGKYLDGRRPESVEFTPSLKEDLKRRDFTINAFAYSPKEGVIDLFDGIADLERGLIRCVGDPDKRFAEDALRIMRAVRFSAQLGFKIEEKTSDAIRRFAPELSRISKERIRVEFEKTLLSDDPGYVNLYRRYGLDKYIFPDVYERCFTDEAACVLAQIRSEEEEELKYLRLSAFFGGLCAEEVRKTLKNFTYDNRTKDTVSCIIKGSKNNVPEDKPSVKRSMRAYGAGIFSLTQKLLIAEARAFGKDTAHYERLLALAAETEENKEPYLISHLAVNGADLIALGIPEGAGVGRVLGDILEKVTDEPGLNTKEQLIMIAKQEIQNTFMEEVKMEPRKVYEEWINSPDVDEATKAELEAIKDDEAEITDRFYQELEFGTAGLRGVMGAGTNRMNKYTVAKATQGMSDYINKFYAQVMEHACDSCGACDGSVRDEHIPAVAIACDSRNNSPEFTQLTASVFNANGIRTYVFESLRPTPELSFAIRYHQCIAGVNITASHNPAEYNGYKAYWADGAQVTPPHDTGIMECVNAVTNFFTPKLMPKEEAVAAGLYIEIGKDDDNAFMDAIGTQVREESLLRQMAKDVSVVYTPLHGAGIQIVPKLLARYGFTNFHVVKEQEKPDGNFPTVPYPNPETAKAFELGEILAKEVDADIILATDPDSDRIGAHVRDKDGNYHTLTGNMIGSLLCEYECSRLKNQGKLPEDAFVVTSIVSGRMFDVIAKSYGVEPRRVLTGFKHIGAEILKSEQTGRGHYIMGYEESYGFMIGTFVRDKDACMAALALCEACAYYKYEDLTLWDVMTGLFEKFGYYTEETISMTYPGVEGAAKIKGIMESFREQTPSDFAGYKVLSSIDYNEPEKTGLPKANVLYYELEGGWMAVRPSGTEPKIKYYIGANLATQELSLDMIAKIKETI